MWDVLYDLFSGDSSINIRLAYDNTEMCRPSCELEIEIDGIRIGPAIRLEATSSLVKYTNSLPIHFSSNANFKIAIHAKSNSSGKVTGLGHPILHMEIFKGNNERLYSTSVINEQLVASEGTVGR